MELFIDPMIGNRCYIVRDSDNNSCAMGFINVFLNPEHNKIQVEIFDREFHYIGSQRIFREDFTDPLHPETRTLMLRIFDEEMNKI